jgi:hypothetical protein
VALDDATLSYDGWHAFEDARGQRWTNGRAALPAGGRLIVIDLAGLGHYWTEDAHKMVALAR